MGRMNINLWRQSLPKAEAIIKQAEKEVKTETIKVLENLSQTWLSENKLIHAGAAQRLAKKLKGNLNDK